MGERLSGDGVPGRRCVHRDDAVSAAGDVRDDTALETVLAAVLRGADLAPEAEQRAVAAFRAARSAGAHQARTRHRDDWRLPAERRTGRSVKTTFAAVFASLTLGGVAIAAIGSVGSAGSSTDGAGSDRKTAHPPVSAPARPGGETSSASSGGVGPTAGSAAAQDAKAHCLTYEQVKDRGKALDATAWQQLAAAAGGKGKVADYCAEHLARSTAAASRSGDPGKPGEGAADAGTGMAANTGTSGNNGTAANTGTSGNTGTAGNGNPGNDADGSDNGAGNGQAGNGKGE